MKELKDWRNNLRREFVVAGGVKTAMFIAPDNHQPIALFVHGFNGSHLGLIGLAAKMTKVRPIFVDMPGHGDSGTPPWNDLSDFRQWFVETYRIISKKFGPPQQIVAHSFGCYMIDTTKLPLATKTIFICPVPSVKWSYGAASRLAHFVFYPKIMVKFYNWYLFSLIRGRWLLKVSTDDSRQYVKFLSREDKAGVEQRRFQMRLAKEFSANWGKIGFRDVTPSLVIIGKKDHLPRQRTVQQMQLIFPSSKIVAIDAGHLAPIENPAAICAEISAKNEED